MRNFIIFAFILLNLFASNLNAQLKWQNVDSLYQPLPSSVHIYKSIDLIDGKPNIAYYVIADLKDKDLDFTIDTTLNRRLTPTQFYQKNDKPLLVVNGTFFSFETHQNLNTVIVNGRQVGFNNHLISGRGKDTLTYFKMLKSAIGISKKREADVAWLYTDSNYKYPLAFQNAAILLKDSINHVSKYSFAPQLRHAPTMKKRAGINEKWKMQTAIGGGPVLLQNGEIKITNNEERMFAGKAIDDRHPRTAMGYTADNKLIILVIQGRNPGLAEGATLTHEAQILKDLGCIEALNLDGGGSSCMLVNGKETINPSAEKGVQRAIPAAFIIKKK